MAGWRPAIATSRTDEDVAGSRLLWLAALAPVRLEPPTKDLSLLLLLWGAASVVSEGLVDLLLRVEENFDFSQEDTLDSPFGSFGAEGPVMVVCVVAGGVILDVNGSVCLAGLVSVADFVAVDGSP